MSLRFLRCAGEYCCLKAALGQWWKQNSAHAVCITVHTCTYLSSQPCPGPSSPTAPSCSAHAVGLAPGTACVTLPAQEGSRVFFPSCQVLSVSISFSFCCSNEIAQLLPAWQQWVTVHIVGRDRAWSMSLIPPSLDFSAPVTCTALWTWEHLCLRSSSAGLTGRALVPVGTVVQ